jgi:hypothetical protein
VRRLEGEKTKKEIVGNCALHDILCVVMVSYIVFYSLPSFLSPLFYLCSVCSKYRKYS